MNKILAPLLVTVLLAAPSLAAAQSQCNERSEVVSLLSKRYQEAPVALGVASNGGLIEVLSTGSGGTWTMIITSPQGVSCLIAAGQGWSNSEAKKGRGDPST